MEKCIERVTKEECNAMWEIYERKLALENLIKISENNSLVKDNNLYEKFVKDYAETSNKINGMWNYLSNKYNLEKQENCFWSIDFVNGDIYLQDR